MIARILKREIETINSYEKKKNIKTNIKNNKNITYCYNKHSQNKH